ncbi:MAG: polyhydroxybutyrate depolymerase [Acidobacteriota bacterium]|jgi:polyhydroxybutyrate depolymerase|nr:polyhydroxybutyrate depolymerase [Acidobacteriota bacterium]
MRRGLKIASLTIVLLLIAFAGLAFWALRYKPPPEPRLPGKVERGALEHGGRTRTWIAYVPTKSQAHPALVIALHSSMGTAEQARQVYGYDFDRLAEKHGFIAVYPQGYEGHWNDCRVKGPFAAKIENVDDVGFLRALVDRLVKDHDADRAHVYVTGVSNGGAMTIRLALQTPDFARAYAAVVSSVPAPENMAITPKGEPVSMLLMNGTADPFNPWDGGDVVLYGVYGNRGPVLSAQASIDYFLKLDGLSGPPSRTQIPDTDPNDGSTAERQRWTAPGKRNLTFIRIQGGGHGIPHPAMYGRRLLGNSNRDFHAAYEIWDFFQQAL